MSQALLEELANAVAAKLSESGAIAVVDLRERRVRVTEHGLIREIFLGNAYDEYVGASPEERRAIVDRYARIVTPDDLAPPSQEDWQRLLPKLVPRRERELLRLRFGNVENLGGTALTDGLIFDLAIDLPERIRMVQQSDLAAAGMAWGEAFELGRRNLLARSKEPWNEVAPGLFLSPWGDYFDGARLSLPTLFPRIGVRGDPIVTNPNRCAMLCTGSEEPHGLALLYEATRQLMQRDRPVHVAALRLVDGAWRELCADDIALVGAVPRLAHLEYLQDTLDYGAVGDHLCAALGELGYHAEPLQAAELEGIVVTSTQLPKASNLVIPHASLVYCNGEPLHWYDLARLLGRNLAKLDVWPAYYEVRRQPTLVEIKAARIR